MAVEMPLTTMLARPRKEVAGLTDARFSPPVATAPKETSPSIVVVIKRPPEETPVIVMALAAALTLRTIVEEWQLRPAALEEPLRPRPTSVVMRRKMACDIPLAAALRSGPITAAVEIVLYAY